MLTGTLVNVKHGNCQICQQEEKHNKTTALGTGPLVLGVRHIHGTNKLHIKYIETTLEHYKILSNRQHCIISGTSNSLSTGWHMKC